MAKVYLCCFYGGRHVLQRPEKVEIGCSRGRGCRRSRPNRTCREGCGKRERQEWTRAGSCLGCLYTNRSDRGAWVGRRGCGTGSVVGDRGTEET